MYTYQYKDDGIILNTDAVLPFVDVTRIDGMDSGEFRASERVREGLDGGFLDADFENMRTIVLDVNVYAEPASINRFLFDLKKNYEPTKVPHTFNFTVPGMGDFVYLCKSLGFKYSISNTIGNGFVTGQIQLKAEDPTMYSRLVHTEVASFGTTAPTNGRGYDKAFNYGYNSVDAVSPGTLVCYNNGTKDAPAIIRLTNVTNPSIIYDNTNKVIRLSSSVVSPDYIELELRNRSVRLNSIVGRGSDIIGGSEWFMLEPGANYLRLTGEIPAGSPTMTVIYRDAYR